MKNHSFSFYLLISFLLINTNSFSQQWDGVSTSTGDIYRTGSVGVGTQPVSLLNVYYGDLLVQDRMLSSTGGGFSYVKAPVLFAGGKTQQFLSSGSSQTPNYAGLVGINTNQPNATLHVKNGSFLVTTGSNEYSLFANQTTNLSGSGLINGAAVGIGTMTPSTKLEISAKGINNASVGNIVLKLSNIYNSAGSNQPTIQFNNKLTNGSIGNYWNLSATVGATGEDVDRFSISYKGNSSEIEIFRVASDGWVYSEQMRVKLRTYWPDYVFAPSHHLMSLSELQQYISLNNHLPEVPDACEMETDGIDVGNMNTILLKKVEELTLYLFDLQKQIDELKNQNGIVK